MAWTWRYLDRDGGDVVAEDLAAQSFPTQGEAESWIGEVWRDLVEAGVDAVTLMEEGRVAYGPMSLHPPD